MAPAPHINITTRWTTPGWDSLDQLTPEWLERYNQSGPRYTSYPTAPMWTEAFDHQAYATALKQTNQIDAPERTLPLSLYVHLPFCEHRCLFCGCNVVITQQREQAEKYLGYLFIEIDRVADFQPDKQRETVQLHWGGGTPTYLNPEQIERLYRKLTERFTVAHHTEVAIEVDPRVTTFEQLAVLRTLGFNRISLGVQDFQPETQQAVERIQPVEQTQAMVDECRRLGFSGINFDLIYGLPHQTEISFDQTLDTVIKMNPDRIALYNFAYVPWLSPHQTQINAETLPGGPTKFAIFKNAIQRLLAAGYVYIGMDHFAKSTDELFIAQQEGRLHRNFMGYTTQRHCELYGLGVSAISGLAGYYAQNKKKLSTYYEAIDAGLLPTWRGLTLNPDDHIRRTAINDILCNGRLDLDTLSAEFKIDANDYLRSSLNALKPMAADGLLEWTCTGLTLTPLGRIFSRNVAMPFDAYLTKPGNTANADAKQPIYSKTL